MSINSWSFMIISIKQENPNPYGRLIVSINFL
nr:MAG TPA: hypothetical protein [Caudoviricetes sp.]